MHRSKGNPKLHELCAELQLALHSVIHAVLIAHDSKKATGWFRGKIKLFGLSDQWKAALPAANFLIKYTKKDTGDVLMGDEARELKTSNYGPGEWWLLLEPVPV